MQLCDKKLPCLCSLVAASPQQNAAMGIKTRQHGAKMEAWWELTKIVQDGAMIKSNCAINATPARPVFWLASRRAGERSL
ncbi:hypothetical protein SLEP1_g7213 [Rubroshorea leprosula]|uniref:Uncharacterized protein n=1 Tax=Rubroshorea leprosula TaxID=152421 RepID=A0AAV5HXN6_9ROSI|nr:hypothetical protein SLEP1_g7213 [Rubroshorea leprosula]